jgi:hypothetical protein
MPKFEAVAAPGARGATVVEFTCAICGQPFRRYASQVRGLTHGKYCSPHCRGLARGRAAAERLRTTDKRGAANPNWRGRRARKQCPICGTWFEGSPNKTCSAECGHTAQGRRIARAGNGNWVSQERHLRRNYRQLLNLSACSVCGDSRRVIAHHLDGDRARNVADNLVALCHWCHTTVHYLAKMRSHDHLPALLKLSLSLA